MKRLFNTKFFIAVIFFCIGFLTNHLLVKVRGVPVIAHNEERFPVSPEDFDHNRMLETIQRMTEGDDLRVEDSMMGASIVGEISQREDDKNIYYDIPQKGHDGVNHKLNVEIKNGMIKVSEDLKSSGDARIETSSERMFSIDPGLDSDKAEIINEVDRIVIKIPKK